MSTHTQTIEPVGWSLQYLPRTWLLTNGSGAYAMGTLPGVNTSRYHALLVAATRPPVGRIVVLNQVLEQLSIARADGQGQATFEFNSLRFNDGQGQPTYAPAGHGMLARFDRDLSVRWEYSFPDGSFVRELFLHWKEQAATIRYAIALNPNAWSVRPPKLRLSPMLTLRDFHALNHRDQGLPLSVHCDRPGLVRIGRSDITVTLTGPGAWQDASPESLWWNGAHYPADAERGQDCFEDLFVPGGFQVDLTRQTAMDIAFSVALGQHPADEQGWMTDERQTLIEGYTHALLEPSTDAAKADASNPPAKTARMLAIASDDFIVERPFQGKTLATIMAGYPWFADWGRDTFIALPGLMLCTARYEQAHDVLKLYAQAIADGLVPNRFDDYDQQAAHYNTVDASLWFIRAAIEYVQCTDDRDAWEEWLAPACMSIVHAYAKGTRYHIHLTGDGLISAGDPTTQLTWMDAACGGQVFTPRPGKAVEINSLWYYALVSLTELLPGVSTVEAGAADHCRRLADRVRRSFAKVFWDEERQFLFDSVHQDDQGRTLIDLALRPNQILAVSLPVSPLPKTKQQAVLAAVGRWLATPVGLRTLATGDPNYHGQYTGNGFERDKAYHQGTIWPWLIGPYAEAILRVGDFTPQAKSQARAVLSPLLEEMLGPTLGQLHEIYEADAHLPGGRHRPVGCMAQAWSVAEVVRIWQMLLKT